MTFSYALRLIVVSLAAFAVIVAIVGIVVSLAAGAAQHAAGRMRASAAARLILFLRLLPAGLGAFLVAAVCVPSYIQFEQRAELEEAGRLCIALSMISCVLLLLTAVRAGRAWLHSAGPDQTLALVGIFRPRIVVSDAAREYLSQAELTMALRHEESHAASRDNFKRLLILLAPGPFPRFHELEQTWKRLAEYAADDRAAAGDPQQSLSLAAALVRIAKLGMAVEHPLVTSFLATSNDLESRVDRLLNPQQLPNTRYVTLACYCLAFGVLAPMLHPATPVFVHALLERLMH
jgi:Zn-dependent protease with chaperone function